MAGRRATKRKEASDAVEQDEVDVRAVERSPSISSGTDESDSEDIELAIDSGSDGDDRSEDTRQSVGAEEEDEDEEEEEEGEGGQTGPKSQPPTAEAKGEDRLQSLSPV